MYKAYIEPDLETAHLRIYNTFNPFSGFMNATYILKSDKPITKQAIKQCLKVCLLSQICLPSLCVSAAETYLDVVTKIYMMYCIAAHLLCA